MTYSARASFATSSLNPIINLVKVRKNRLYIFTTLFSFIFLINNAASQCTVNSSGCGGYTVDISFNPIDIVPGSTICPFGYTYNVQFSYSITVSGVNTCTNGNITIQPQISCNSQSNGHFTFSVPAPIVGNPSTSVTYTGTLTTTSNPYRTEPDCNTATPASINCMNLQVTVFGPGILVATYPCNFVLPVELLSFSGACKGDIIALEWSTASETNNDFFTIEHSADAVKWQNIGTAEGAGNSSHTLHYTFTDTYSYYGVTYFRLRQTDMDGSFKYSDIIEVKSCRKDINSSDFIIYPNPVQGVINLLFNGDNDDVRSIEIINLNGQKIYNSDVFQSNIDLSALQSGIYFIRVNLDSKIITKMIALER